MIIKRLETKKNTSSNAGHNFWIIENLKKVSIHHKKSGLDN